MSVPMSSIVHLSAILVALTNFISGCFNCNGRFWSSPIRSSLVSRIAHSKPTEESSSNWKCSRFLDPKLCKNTCRHSCVHNPTCDTQISDFTPGDTEQAEGTEAGIVPVSVRLSVSESTGFSAPAFPVWIQHGSSLFGSCVPLAIRKHSHTLCPLSPTDQKQRHCSQKKDKFVYHNDDSDECKRDKRR